MSHSVYLGKHVFLFMVLEKMFHYTLLGAWPKGEECNDHKYWVLKVQVCLSLTSAEPFRLL